MIVIIMPLIYDIIFCDIFFSAVYVLVLKAEEVIIAVESAKLLMVELS